MKGQGIEQGVLFKHIMQPKAYVQDVEGETENYLLLISKSKRLTGLFYSHWPEDTCVKEAKVVGALKRHVRIGI